MGLLVGGGSVLMIVSWPDQRKPKDAPSGPLGAYCYRDYCFTEQPAPAKPTTGWRSCWLHTDLSSISHSPFSQPLFSLFLLPDTTLGSAGCCVTAAEIRCTGSCDPRCFTHPILLQRLNNNHLAQTLIRTTCSFWL